MLNIETSIAGLNLLPKVDDRSKQLSNYYEYRTAIYIRILVHEVAHDHKVHSYTWQEKFKRLLLPWMVNIIVFL